MDVNNRNIFGLDTDIGMELLENVGDEELTLFDVTLDEDLNVIVATMEEGPIGDNGEAAADDGVTNEEAKPVAGPSGDGPMNEKVVPVCFGSVAPSARELQNFIRGQQNLNTQRKTDSCVNKFRGWLASNYDFHDDIVDIETSLLDCYVGEWLMQLRKSDGSEYEPDSLTSFHRGLARYLREHSYKECILTHASFDTSRRVLAAKRKQLKSKGMGNKPNRAEPLSDTDVERLWECGQLGLESPVSLLNTVWYMNTYLLGFRGNHESRQMTWGDLNIEYQTNDDGVEEEVLRWRERQTKTRQDGSRCRDYIPTMYPNTTNPARCPIEAYKKYKSQRPPQMCGDEDPFYLAINYNKSRSHWYKCQPVGQNHLGSMMKRMCKEAGLQLGRVTNHSIRKSAITKLVHDGIDATKVAQYSGHKNVASINNYSSVSKQQQRDMCHRLQNIPVQTQKSTHLAIGGPGQIGQIADAPVQVASIVSVPNQPILNRKCPEMSTAGISTGNSTVLSGMFAGASISGGVFHINMSNQESSVCSAPTPAKQPCLSDNNN